MSAAPGFHLPDPGPLASPPRSWLLVWDGGPEDRHPYPFETFTAAERFAAQLAPEAHPNLRAVPWGVAR